MYRVTGVRLVESFLRTRTEGTLLICHEGFPGAFPVKQPRLRTYSLKRSALLNSWLARNRDIIPRRFGGAARDCDCPVPRDPFSRHRLGCHAYWFNQNACRWFRKIVSLQYALRLPAYDTVVWVDADCVFKRPLPESVVAASFSENAVYYLKSGDREVMESGVIGIRTSAEGRKFIAVTVDRYRSGAFRNDPRWDDSYQFQRTLREHPDIPSIDIATGAIGKKPYGYVLPCSPLAPYLFHQKGFHARTLKSLS